MNRKTGLQNTGIVCPELYTYLNNTYQKPSDLFVAGSKGLKIKSQEGTTQGDTTAMAFYALSLMKLIEDAKTKAPAAKEVFYADDGATGGKLDAVSHFWRYLQEDGPKYGYFVNPSKSYLIVKPGVRKEAEELFPNVNITTEGHRYLGSFIGTEEGTKKFVQDQVKLWLRDLEGLCNIAQHEPHLSYCAYIYGTSKRWNYIMRTTPQISEHLEDIESYISKKLIPSFTGHHVGIDHRAIFTLPVIGRS